MRREREVLRQAQTQVVEEREVLEGLFRDFMEMFREFKQAVRDLVAELESDDEDGSFVDMIDGSGCGDMGDGMAREVDAGEQVEEGVSSGMVSRKRRFSEAFPRPVEVLFEEEEMEGMRRLSDASRKWFEDHELDLELLRRE